MGRVLGDSSDDVIHLGLVLKNLDNFDMSTFRGRLIFQKSVYLMQAFGVYLGYHFSWYLRGPYSPRLTRDGYALHMAHQDVRAGSFEAKSTQTKFEKFLRFMEDKKDDPERLEILASIHFLKKIYRKMSKADIISRVESKQSYFRRDDCERGWDELEREGLI